MSENEKYSGAPRSLKELVSAVGPLHQSASETEKADKALKEYQARESAVSPSNMNGETSPEDDT